MTEKVIDKCDICENPVLLNNEGMLNSVPASWDDSHLCYECTDKGWWHCEVCHKPHDFTNINPDDFELIFNKVSNRKIYKLDSICSNKCYNLKHLEYEISYFYNIVIEVKVLGIHDDKSDEEKEKMLEYPSRKLEELTNIRDSLLNE
jgi:hypothetical protein